LTGGFFDPDTDPDPDADKAGMLLFTVSSRFEPCEYSQNDI
jgi:hypothetical protein